MTTLEEKLRLRLQEEIIEQKARYGRLFQEFSFKDGYYACAAQLKKLVWHTKKEKPVPGNYILITDGNGFMYVNNNAELLEYDHTRLVLAAFVCHLTGFEVIDRAIGGVYEMAMNRTKELS